MFVYENVDYENMFVYQPMLNTLKYKGTDHVLS